MNRKNGAANTRRESTITSDSRANAESRPAPQHPSIFEMSRLMWRDGWERVTGSKPDKQVFRHATREDAYREVALLLRDGAWHYDCRWYSLDRSSSERITRSWMPVNTMEDLGALLASSGPLSHPFPKCGPEAA